MKVLHAFVIKCVALFTTKVIMNVIASMEAPKNPVKNCTIRAQFEKFYFLEPKRAIEPTGLGPINNVLLPFGQFRGPKLEFSLTNLAKMSRFREIYL